MFRKLKDFSVLWFVWVACKGFLFGKCLVKRWKDVKVFCIDSVGAFTGAFPMVFIASQINSCGQYFSGERRQGKKMMAETRAATILKKLQDALAVA